MATSLQDEIENLHRELLEAWNNRDARTMSDLFVEKGEIIGYDGSEEIGREDIYNHLNPIFESRQTARFVYKVKRVSRLSSDTMVLRAIAGMVPLGESDINPKVNMHQTLIAQKIEGIWQILLFQNTPAQFHGRPELVEKMTAELREMLR